MAFSPAVLTVSLPPNLTNASRRFGYVPYDATLTQAGDRRRFCWWARARDVSFEIAEPSRDYDIVYLTPRADISVWSRYRGRAKLVYEMIDAYLAVPNRSPKSLLRGSAKFVTRENRRLLLNYRKGIEAMCRRADAVVCGTAEQQAVLMDYCPNTQVILDAHDEITGLIKTDFAITGTLRLVWEGLPENLRGFEVLRDLLAAIAAERPIEIHLVTALNHARYMGRYFTHPTSELVEEVLGGLADVTVLHHWTPETLARVATSADLAVIPLNLDDRLAAGKPANKLLGFWRMGLPTLTSATPAYVEAMTGAGVSMTCRTAAEWSEALRRAIGDEAWRREAAERGRRYTQTHHGEKRLLDQWDALFASVLEG